jgi:hypothetical protein
MSHRQQSRRVEQTEHAWTGLAYSQADIDSGMVVMAKGVLLPYEA